MCRPKYWSTTAKNPVMQRYIEDFKGLEKHVGGLHSICHLFNEISKLEAERASWKKEVDDQKEYVTSLEMKIADLIEYGPDQ